VKTFLSGLMQDEHEDDELNLAFGGRRGKRKKKRIGMKRLGWVRN